MDAIATPHDTFFRESFGRREIAVDFLRSQLPPALLTDGSSSRRIGILACNRLNKNRKMGAAAEAVTAYNAFAVWRGKRRPSASRRARCSSSG
jgi:hypothetical protein